MAMISRAGGRATQEGMTFEAAVGTWFAAYISCQMPIGARFGLTSNAIPIEVQFETGHNLDDIEIRLSNGGSIFVQCKTRPSMSASGLGSTIAQLVSLRFSAPSIDLSNSAAVLAVAADAASTLNDLENACRIFDLGDRWSQAKARVNRRQVRALNVFEDAVRVAWKQHSESNPTDEELVSLAKLFHVSRFDVERGRPDWVEAARVVGTRLFGKDEAGEDALIVLSTAVEKLIRNGAVANQRGLVGAMRAAGLNDTRSPNFNEDIGRLQKLSRDEMLRLERHRSLPIAKGIPISRDCITAFTNAADGGSLLVIGEPGAGKTGVMVNLAEDKLTESAPVVFLSVDRLAGITTNDNLRSELHLRNPILDVLEAWPGLKPGFLFIDALDASRGGAAEAVFATLIEDAIVRLGERWSIIASIRTFDLQNGRRFRKAMAGEPPARSFSEPGLEGVRHFRVPRLSDGELNSVASAHSELGTLIRVAPSSVRELFRNVFNLSLAAELVSGGVSAQSISAVSTQSDLIDRYEDERLCTSALQSGVAAVVAVMVNRRALTVPRFSIKHDALDDVLKSGVLATAGDRVAFAHHVLFDHAAGRFFLDWDRPENLRRQVADTPGIGLLLGPSLRFAMERVWRNDGVGRPETWKLIASITAIDELDPVVASVVLRTAAERVFLSDDVIALCDLLRTPNAPVEKIGLTLSRLARFVSMSFEEERSIGTSAVAWAMVARIAVEAGQRHYADGARFLLQVLFDKGDFSGSEFANAFGEAARALLSFAWNMDPEIPLLATNAIRFVARTYGTNSAASRLLLSRILVEPRFSEHAHEEAPWLAEGVRTIFPVDPSFVVEIYAALFGRPAPKNGKTWLGGVPSRILPITSDRQQQYEHARWRLRRVLPEFLRYSAVHGTRAVIAASIGKSRERRNESGDEINLCTVSIPGQTIEIVEDLLTLQEWRVRRGRSTSPDEDFLAAFAGFLRVCSSEEFRAAITTTQSEVGATSVWARLFGVAADRVGIADDLLWPIATALPVLEMIGVARDAIVYVGTLYASRSEGDRRAFEEAIIERTDSLDEEQVRKWSAIASRVLSEVPVKALVTSRMRELGEVLSQEGKLNGNRPVLSIEVGSAPLQDFTDRHLRRQGVDLDGDADGAVRDVGRVLDDLLRDLRDDDNHPAIVEKIWPAARALMAKIACLRHAGLHSATLHASWGAIGNALEIVAKSEAYRPDQGENPSILRLLRILDQMMRSPYPELREEKDSALMGWGNWDVRVYAASALVALARRFGTTWPALVVRLPAILGDPVPTVRLQIAQSVNVLWDVDRRTMWSMVDRIAAEERNIGVLTFFIAGPLNRLAGAAPDHVENLISGILERILASSSSDSKQRIQGSFEEAIGNIAARLWVGNERKAARAWIDGWINDPVAGQGCLWHVVSALRGALFERFGSNATADHLGVQERAREVLHSTVVAAAAIMDEGTGYLEDVTINEELRKRAEELYRAGDRLIDHACNQLYFGAGVFRGSSEEEPVGLEGLEAMRLFLDEYSSILDLIGKSGSAQTTHHLVELYEYIIAAAPEAVFDRISALLVGQGARGGYHFESLGSDVLVRLIRRYLADYREVFSDSERRANLIRVLELFSSAGWPGALKLLYELPDLLR